MERLWRGMGGGRPPHRQHGLSCSPAVRYFFWSEPGPPTMVLTKHETRITAFMLFTNHSFPTHDFPPFPTISRHFPAPPPPSADQVSTRRPPFLVSRPDCRAAPRCPVTAFLRAMARHGRRPPLAPATRPFLFTGRQIFLLERTRPPNHGSHETRDTNHETRVTAFMFFTSHDSRNMVFLVPPATPRRATPSPTNGFFTRHESRLFLACFDRRVVRNAGY